MFIFKRQLPAPERELETISSPFGEIFVDEWKDHFRFWFAESDFAFFLRAKGDLLQIEFNLSGVVGTEKHLRAALWLLTDVTVRHIVNPKFGNQPSLKFSAALYGANDNDGRHCVLLPDDTIPTATKRFETVWYKQAPMSGYVGKLSCHVMTD